MGLTLLIGIGVPLLVIGLGVWIIERIIERAR